MSSRSTPVPLSRAVIVALLCEGLLAGPLIAQNPPPAFQPPPAPATATGVPPVSTGNPPGLPGAPAAESDELVQLQLPNFDVRDVLQFYERLTGKRLVLDSTIQGQLNVVVQGKIPKSEAIKILETALLLNGFSIVPGDGITKVLGLSKNARGAGVSIYSDLNSLPEGELVVSYLFRLRFLDPTELQQILQQYVTANLYTSFVALPKSGALLVTESTSVIRKLVQLVREVDLPPADVVQEFVQLQRADATKAVEFLNAVFEKKEAAAAAGGAGRPGAARRPGTPAANPAAPVPPVAVPAVLDTQAAAAAVAALTEDSIIVGKISLNADIRTNRVHVVTRPVNMPFVRRLISDYDSSTVFATPVKRRLNHINARDVLPILVASLTEPGTDGAGGAAGGARPAATTTNPGASSSLFANQGNRGTTGSTGSGSGGGLNLTQGLETAPVDTTPTTATVGNTKLIADPRENSIIVQGSSEARDRCFKILEELDVEAPQVAIYAVIGEFSLGDGISSGIDYILNRAGPVTAGSNFTGLVQGSTSTTTNGNTTTTGSAFDRGNPPLGTPVSSVTNLAGTLLSGFTGAGAIIRATDRFDIILRALESSNRFKTISRPMIFTSNNKKAVIASGQEIAIPANFTSGFTGASSANPLATTASVQFKSVTLQLEVVPLINSKNRVNLDILQKIDSVVAGGGTNVAGTNIPTIATRFVRSNVSVPNLGTVVLGGLIQSDESKTGNGLPLLSRIPVLGNLFKSNTTSNNRRELIILLRPVVTNTDVQIARNRKVVEDEMYMGDNLEGQLEPYFKKKPTTPLRPNAEVRKAVPVPVSETRTVVKTTTVKKKPAPAQKPAKPADKQVVRKED